MVNFLSLFIRLIIFPTILFSGLAIYLVPGILETPASQTQPPSITSPSAPCSAVSTRYPEAVRRWCIPIERNASQYQLDANLIAAVMLQESGGNPQAYSHSGAVGLLQVMPRDGLAAHFQCNGRPCFGNRPSMAELYDPEFNLSFGIQMLASLVNRHGNSRDALRYYGPADVGYSYADLVLTIYKNYQ